MTKTNITAEHGRQEIVITHIFDAPRELVWNVYTDPKLMPRWWGPRILNTTVDQMDMRPGGIWRIVQRAPDGTEFGFHGAYHDIQPPERIVDTFEFEGMPGHVLLETITFEDFEGKTKVTNTSIFQSVKDRDGMLNSNMDEGVTESNDRFAELLKEMQ
jgi:uncharacterized protein YndB with AHSA1/START domain